MKQLIVIATALVSALAAPSNYGTAGVVAHHGVAGVAHAGVAHAGVVAAGPHAVGVAPVVAHAPLPAPYTTAEVTGPGQTHVSRAPAQVSKQVHLGSTTYVSGIHHEIIKPPTPHFPISVPTALKGTTQVTAPLVKTVKEPFVVNQPVPVERRVEVPYDVPVVHERVNHVPVPVHVSKPVAVPVPTPVVGEPIVKVSETAPIVKNVHHHNVVAAVAGYPHAGVAAIAGYPHAGVAAVAGYPHAGVASVSGYPSGYGAHQA